jgi:protoporphyrinogen oxidase
VIASIRSSSLRNGSGPGRIVIIGAGPTGLGAGYRLQELGYRDWSIYERNSYVGGLAASFTDSSGFTYDIGGHVMFSHYRYFDALVDRLLGVDYSELLRESWIRIAGTWVPYPLQNNVRYLPADMLLECLTGLIDCQGADAASAHNFGEWVLAVFGRGIADYFMRPYNFKVWAHPLEMMSKSWIAERVSVIDLKRVLANVIQQRDDAAWGPNNKFKYPLYGGTGGLYLRLQPYVSDHLNLQRSLVEIDLSEKTLRFADGSCDSYDELITTVPIPQLLAMMRPRPDSLIDLSRQLHNSHGLVVGVGVSRPANTPRCWTYFPESNTPFYRMTYLSNYSPNMAPPGHMNLLTETSYSDYRQVDKANVVDAVIDGLIASEVLRDSDRELIVTTHTLDVEYFYPVPTLGRDAALDEIQSFLLEHDISSRGRFGAWRYEESNMDHSVMQGVEVVDRLLLGTPEVTWKLPARRMPRVAEAVG